MRKQKLYALAQDITPPILFKFIKRTRFYSFLKKIFDKFNESSVAKVVVVETGPLQGLSLKFNPDGAWQQQMLSGTYDKEILEIVTKLSLTDKTIYDIGAHIGIHSLLFAKLVGKDGAVHGFEPNQYNAERFKEIVTLNPELSSIIHVHQLALGEEVGETMFLSNNDLEGGSSTGGFVDKANTIWKREVYLEQTGFTPTPVKQDTVDNLVDSQTTKPPALLKIDVEGAEQLVLEGARKTILTHKPVIIIELHSIFSAYDCMRILRELNYSTKVLHKEEDGRVIIFASTT